MTLGSVMKATIRIVVWPHRGQAKGSTSTREELEGVQSLAARGRTRRLVRVIGDGAVIFLILHAAERHGVPCAVTGEAYGELAVVGCDPNSVVRVESRVLPGEHALRRLDVHHCCGHVARINAIADQRLYGLLVVRI